MPIVIGLQQSQPVHRPGQIGEQDRPRHPGIGFFGKRQMIQPTSIPAQVQLAAFPQRKREVG